jgi:SAM-dependent methyltransferase
MTRIPKHRSAELHYSACPVCACSELAVLFAKGGYPLGECRNCRLRFLNPQPDDSTLRIIYSPDYFLGATVPQVEARVSQMKRANASLYLDLISKYANGTLGQILEIGCGRGEFLLEAQARGFTVSGIEISPTAAAIANQRLGTEQVVAGTLENVHFPEAYFDAVAFADVIEHIREPMDFLRRVFSLLKPGGMVFIVTPSLDSWSAKLMGRQWMEYKIEHLYYFGKRTIRLALDQIGFKEILIQPNFKILSLDYIYHHFFRFPVPLITPLLRLLQRVTPKGLTHRHIKLVASGLVAMARKPDGRTSS